MEDTIQKHLTIKSWAEDDRPREKLVSKGRQALSDAELLAILLSSGNRDETAVRLAQRILNEYANSINELAKASLHDLMTYKGVGEAKAVTIAAALEIGRRRGSESQDEKIKITSSKNAFAVLKSKLTDLPHEEFWVIFMSRSNSVIKTECISRGGISGTVVDIRLILKPAIHHLASAIILAHNHPSGNLKPSQEDIHLTKKIKEAAKLMDISLQDHLIIGDQSYLSFADEGLI
ncbi:MAG: repair protein RadC [Bacteroidota bacterium]|jgi:DNA repair protein RadC|nr:repair protein RadC [Bacteroidota bacterium]